MVFTTPLRMRHPQVIIRTEITRNTLGRKGCVEHMEQGNTIDITGMHTDTYDAPSELIEELGDRYQEMEEEYQQILHGSAG